MIVSSVLSRSSLFHFTLSLSSISVVFVYFCIISLFFSPLAIKRYHVELWADNMPYARSLCRSPSGTIFVGSFNFDNPDKTPTNVYAFTTTSDFRVKEKFVVATNLTIPNGVAFHNGDLYIALLDRVIKVRDVERNLRNPPPPVDVIRLAELRVVSSFVSSCFRFGSEVFRFAVLRTRTHVARMALSANQSYRSLGSVLVCCHGFVEWTVSFFFSMSFCLCHLSCLHPFAFSSS